MVRVRLLVLTSVYFSYWSSWREAPFPVRAKRASYWSPFQLHPDDSVRSIHSCWLETLYADPAVRQWGSKDISAPVAKTLITSFKF